MKSAAGTAGNVKGKQMELFVVIFSSNEHVVLAKSHHHHIYVCTVCMAIAMDGKHDDAILDGIKELGFLSALVTYKATLPYIISSKFRFISPI